MINKKRILELQKKKVEDLIYTQSTNLVEQELKEQMFLQYIVNTGRKDNENDLGVVQKDIKFIKILLEKANERFEKIEKELSQF